MPNPVGRPLTFTLEQLQEKAKEYLAINLLPKEEGGLGEAIPSAVGLACFLAIDKTTLYRYSERFPEFCTTLNEIQALQEQVALNRGIDGTFNAPITKLVLANHGYHEKVVTESTNRNIQVADNKAKEALEEI
jgi:hypothetical protein